MLKIKYKNAFKKDIERVKKRGKDIRKLKTIMQMLIEGKLLPQQNKDHLLGGNYKNHRECHIEPDWLLIYKKHLNELIFERTGTHSDLFN